MADLRVDSALAVSQRDHRSVKPDPLLARTTIGEVEGFIDPAYTEVRQWLGIPFAEPPIGERRFAHPVQKRPLPDGERWSAKTMPPAPAQTYTTKPDFYSTYVPEFLASGPYSEDCLYLNVFAPREVAKQPLPTVVFFYPGEGHWGGINAPYYQPMDWVQRSQKHIVVMFNYRVGILGFPNAKGLAQPAPLGLLDQRIALEFVRDNIAAFGGTPTNITALGHAAGSYAIQAHLFAWPHDPIITAAICLSGFLHQTPPTRDMEKRSFSLIARRMGCPEDTSPEDELAFLRGVDLGALLGCVRMYMDSGAEPATFFRPQEDGVYMFSLDEQLKRASQGRFAKVDMILCMSSHEGNALAPVRGVASGEAKAIAASARWTALFQNALEQVLEYRVVHSHLTYRALYAGDFENISPRPWMKAYHFSELPMIMGTHEIERGSSTFFQKELSITMQQMLVAFASDPEYGLSKWQWQPASRNNWSAMVLGKGDVLYRQDLYVPKTAEHFDGGIPFRQELHVPKTARQVTIPTRHRSQTRQSIEHGIDSDPRRDQRYIRGTAEHDKDESLLQNQHRPKTVENIGADLPFLQHEYAQKPATQPNGNGTTGQPMLRKSKSQGIRSVSAPIRSDQLPPVPSGRLKRWMSRRFGERLQG